MSKLRKGYAAAVALGLTLAASVPTFAQTGGFSLPDTGVDIAAGTTAVITKIGTVVLVAVGGALAFLAVRKGLKWANKCG
ncbi:MAG TPA: hypothetical protein VHQ47_05980 [Phycisphaerae bacterium]|jgi:hypothetical protein|nr:hypothetical protein [Phycisphaerae bacterium]